MNHEICEREPEISAAIRGGIISPELTSHAELCRACSDVLLVSGFLRTNSALTEEERIALPNPGLILRKAQRRATEHAVRLAARPIRWMTVLACLAFACSPWLRLVLPLAHDLTFSWSRTVDSNSIALSRMWSAMPNEPVFLLAVSGTLLILALSSWLMLREE